MNSTTIPVLTTTEIGNTTERNETGSFEQSDEYIPRYIPPYYPTKLEPQTKSTLDIIIASTVLSLLLIVLVVAVMKWKKKDEEEMRLKEEEYMNSRRVSQANINR